MTVPPPPPPPDEDGGPTDLPPPPTAPDADGRSDTTPPAAAFPPPPITPDTATAPLPPPPLGAAAPPTAYASPSRPPRPPVRGAAILVIAGALVSGIAVYLPWMTGGGETFNGADTFVTGRSFADVEIIERPGDAMLFFAAVLVGLGVALYFAGRVLAVAILTIVGAAVAVLLGIGMVAIVDDSRDFIGTDTLSFGIGVMLQPIGPALSLAGSIWATATRRR